MVYPSGKLGALTRLKNKITKFCEETPNADSSALTDLKQQLQSKLTLFDDACKEQLSKDVPDEDKDEFKKWSKKHTIGNTIFMSKLDILIAEADEDYEKEDSDEESKTNSKSDITELVKHLSKMQMSSELPRNEPDSFSGEDITDYQTFKLTFEMMIEQKSNSFSDKFFYLLRYTSGEAHELVKSCHCDDNKRSYESAKATLDKHYGNEYKIAQQYLNKLHDWPQIKSEDHGELRRFATFLSSCLNLMQKMDSLNQLNSMRDIRDTLLKLPWNMRTQFRKITHDTMKNNKAVNFKLLVDFVTEQSEILNVPLIGDISERKPDKENIKKKTKAVSGTKSFATSNNEAVDGQKYCQCCKKRNHSLNDCLFFAKKTNQDKVDFIKKLNLCYGCLRTSEHRSRDCKDKLVCKTCNKTHPTSLHKDVQKDDSNKSQVRESEGDENEERNVNLVVKRKDKIMCPVIPVILKSKNSKNVVTTYMALDNWSTSSFMDKKLLQELNVEGTEETTSLTTIEGQNMKINITNIKDLEVMSLNNNNKVILSAVYAKDNWPFNKEDLPSHDSVKDFKEFKHIPFQFIDSNIGLLVGMNEAEVMRPLEIVATSKRGPYASRHSLGWCFNGSMKGIAKEAHCYRMKTESMKDVEEKIDRFFSQDFEDASTELHPSIDEKKWLDYVENHTRRQANNHFEISLPFKKEPDMPNNFFQVHSRLKSLQQKLLKDDNLKKEYIDFMNTMITRKFAELVPPTELQCPPGKSWFLTHHAVRHKKKGKLRIVFDASLKYNGTSLNSVLWKGPDLANSLVGVLLRFRDQLVAVSGDIEKMYYMIDVPEAERNYLKFFWFESNDISSEPVQYRLTVHLFGATTSSSVANFALKRTCAYTQNIEVKNVIDHSFYVDDMLASFVSEEKAIATLKEIQKTLVNYGFNLTSYASNSKNALRNIPEGKLSKQIEKVCIDSAEISSERALGLKWNTIDDKLGFYVELPEQPNTRRGVLSTIASIYDPLFLVTPALIPAKRIFQILCSLKMNWDDLLPEHLLLAWENWKQQITNLKDFSIARCFRVAETTHEVNAQLHIFVDGSETAYGAVAYLRIENEHDYINTSLVMSKSRLTPLDRASLKTVPRIELASARLGVELYEKIIKELSENMCIHRTYFWTDSTSNLRYINADDKRFQRFVANRVSYIRNLTDKGAWKHVPGNLNPADTLSRGIKDVQKFNKDDVWKNGPAFLKESEDKWPKTNIDNQIPDDDTELKKGKGYVLCSKVDNNEVNSVDKLMNSTSSLIKLKYRVATFLRLKHGLKNKNLKTGIFSIEEVKQAEEEIWKYSQRQYFANTLSALKNGKDLQKSNPLRKFTPFIDEKGLVRVGGRISNANIPYNMKHPIILHSASLPVKLLIKDVHEKMGHLGKESTISDLRQEYHIVKANKELQRIIKQCIICRRVQARPLEQKMAELPADRVAIGDPPFTNTGTDIFGPFYVSRGRGKCQEKRYGIIFTCLTTRASHLEIAPSLETDSFINSFRRFICRRGKPRLMRSDNGTNLTSADKELKSAIALWNENKINQYCLQNQIEWKFQPPYASHFGGVFERQIRTVRKILNSMLLEFGNKTKITDDLLNTFFCEVENIMNNKPIAIITSREGGDVPLRPNDLLRLNASDIECPPGIFSKDDTFSKKKWRQSQYLADVFWNRFKKEYIPLQNFRQKWHKDKRSLQVGDIVIVSDLSTPRNSWCLGKIASAKVSKDGLVRSADIDVFQREIGKLRRIQRPIDKLVILVEN